MADLGAGSFVLKLDIALQCIPDITHVSKQILSK